MSIKIALAGNPNSGKTTLFNNLTGSNQYVGNWPGVTVEKKEGKLKGQNDVIIQDLPGIYSLSPYTLEEVVSRQYLVTEKPDAILNIVDGSNIERNLYLTTQLLELGIPTVVAINMMDIVRKNGDQIDTKKLAKELGCAVMEMSALKSDGVTEVANAVVAAAKAGNKGECPHVFEGSVEHAIAQTWGEVLMHGGQLCDARFSKSCGGVLEEFENCWQDHHHDYLEVRRDGENEQDFPDLTREDNAAEWILSSPAAFCNTHDPEILSQVLNDYDQETTDFYRWRVEYTQQQLADLIARRTGVDYGRIRDLQPVARGTSGRLYKMRIVGEKRSQVIGKELAIRYALSETALYSSAFIVERHDIDADGYPAKFVLRGAGWGHGVGLCQIGAAVMGAKGYNYKQILLHYFVGANIEKQY